MQLLPLNSLRNFIYSLRSMAIGFLPGGRIILRTIIRMSVTLSLRLGLAHLWEMCIGLGRLAKMGERPRRSLSAAQTRYPSITDRTISTARSLANECLLSRE